jgi:alpha-N-acetylglucosaminidase
MQKHIRFVILLFLSSAGSGVFAQVNQESSASFIKRIVSFRADEFVIEEIPRENDKDVFELESKNNKVILRGNNGLSVASALNYYLKNYCFSDIGWNGTNLNIPTVIT